MAAAEPAPSDDARVRLERARSLLHDAFDQPLRLPEIAKQAAMSRYHFVRSFRREFDVTPRQYLIGRRIEQAKHLLQRTSMSVTEVCMEVGFSSHGSFSTLFRREVGCSPSAYRRVLVQSLGVPSVCPPIPCCFLSKFAPQPSPSTRAIFEKHDAEHLDRLAT